MGEGWTAADRFAAMPLQKGRLPPWRPILLKYYTMIILTPPFLCRIIEAMGAVLVVRRCEEYLLAFALNAGSFHHYALGAAQLPFCKEQSASSFL